MREDDVDSELVGRRLVSGSGQRKGRRRTLSVEGKDGTDGARWQDDGRADGPLMTEQKGDDR
jgi:hypothetical protein